MNRRRKLLMMSGGFDPDAIAYIERVLSDSGQVLNTKSEVNRFVRGLKQDEVFADASIVNLAGGVKAGKLYNVKGTDFTVARNSKAWGLNRDGVLQEFAVNVPRTVFDSAGNLLGTLVEHSASNLLGETALLATQSRTVTAGAHTISFYGTGEIVLSGAGAGTLTGTGVNNRVSLTFTATADTLTVTVTGDVTFAQLETGSIATSYIENTGSPGTSVTRLADNILSEDIDSEINNSTFTVLFKSTITADASNRTIFEMSFTNNRLEIRLDSSNNLQIVYVRDDGIIRTQSTSTSALGVNSFALSYNLPSNEIKLYKNGSLITTTTESLMASSFDSIKFGSRVNNSQYLNSAIHSLSVINRVLTLAEIQALS